MQFFQFDREGNMYVFAPGAGCTGPTRLVRPGDEMIFNPTYNPANWATDNTMKTESEDRELALTCPGQCEQTSGHKNFSDETMKQVCWIRKMYREWGNYRHSNGFDYIACDLEDKATISAESLKFALCRFIMEVKRLDGNDFPGKMLHHLIICIQFRLECLGFVLKLVNDPAFHDVKFTLDNTMKARVCQGIGISVMRAEVLTATDEDLLWSMGLLGMAHPEQLLNTVIFCISKGFTLQAGQEHQALRGLPFNSQFKFMCDTDGEIFLWYREDISLKTNKGGLKHRKIEAKTVDLYGSANTERCPLQAIIHYLSLFPKNRSYTAFYLQPWKKYFGKAWYINCPAGINRLRTAVGAMWYEAGLPSHYTNHSLPTKLYQNSVDKQIIMEITGHQSLAVRAYKRTSERQKEEVSKCLFRPPWWSVGGTPPDYITNKCINFAFLFPGLSGPWHYCCLLYY